MRKTASVLLLALCAGAAWAQPAYKSADIDAGLSAGTNPTPTARLALTAAGYDQSVFNCWSCLNPTPVSGHVIYDSAVFVPPTGTTNVSSIGAIEGVPNSSIFELDIGGDIQYHFGDPGTVQALAIQYSNGAFNGFIFAQEFLSPNGTALLRLRGLGPTFELRRLSVNNVSANLVLFTGRFIPSGPFGLSNVQDFDPASVIPEPGSYALLLAGLGLLGFAARRRRADLFRGARSAGERSSTPAMVDSPRAIAAPASLSTN